MKKELIIKVFMYGVLIIFCIAVTFNSCERFYSKLNIPVDNPLEEAIEDVIEKETGVKIDMTPESEEK